MKSKLFFILLIITTLIACEQSSKSNAAKVKKTISFMRQDTADFSFSPEGKIIQRISFSGVIKQYFAYEDTRVIEKSENSMNREQLNFIYFLNKKGQADSSIRFGSNDTICLSYKYDAAGFKTEEYIGCVRKQLVKKRIVEGGNVTQEILYSDDKAMQFIYFSYYPDKQNKSTAYGEEMLGYTFKGKDSKNLLKEMVLVSPTKDTLFFNSFFYHFDDDDRVSLVSIYTNTGMLIDSVAYYY